MSAPQASPVIMEPMMLAAAALTASSAAFAAGAPGVPAAASVAASGTLIVASEVALAAPIAAAAAAGTPRHCSLPPVMTLRLPGPGNSMPGSGCTTGSNILAAGPLGITMLLRLHHRYGATDNQAARHRHCVTQIVRIFGSPNRWCREIIPTFKL